MNIRIDIQSIYVPGSLYAICRVPPNIDGLRGWRMRSHAYKRMCFLCVFQYFYIHSFCSIFSSQHANSAVFRGIMVMLGSIVISHVCRIANASEKKGILYTVKAGQERTFRQAKKMDHL
ncbi:PREDICTED: PRUPE_2G214700 [Prunus dulcis]|uniref:PREDICTED: PRUPE_2G214700 n=1 Tax=Prunus dulcis TaxID=3755 RepID=A0A5E4EEQ2_PRUDU|nr:PREDICTED: PRUPE_2G214700 [Prunus dulcis]